MDTDYFFKRQLSNFGKRSNANAVSFSVLHALIGLIKIRTCILIVSVMIIAGFSVPTLGFALDQFLIGDLEKNLATLVQEVDQLQEDQNKPEINKSKERLKLLSNEFLTILELAASEDSAEKNLQDMIVIIGKMIEISDHIDSSAGQSELYKLSRTIGQIEFQAKELYNNVLVSKYNSKRLQYVLIGCIFLILFLICVAVWSRRKIFQIASDKDKIANFAMKQTFGLPVGSIRGIMALLISMLFVLSVFWGQDITKDIPEVIKIIVSLVFGFYFAKSTDHSKDLMEAMLGKGKERVGKQKDAQRVLAEARAEGANTFAPSEKPSTLFKRAEEALRKADQSDKDSAALPLYEESMKFAEQAKDAAIELKAEKDEESRKIGQEGVNTAINETFEQIDDLDKMDVDARPFKDAVKTAQDMAQKEDYEGAKEVLRRARETMGDTVKFYEEARKIYQEKISADQTEELEKIKEELDKAKAANETKVDGQEAVELLLPAMAAVKEADAKLLPGFKRRALGKPLLPEDYLPFLQEAEENVLSKVFKESIAAQGIGVSDDLIEFFLTNDAENLRSFVSSPEDQWEKLYMDTDVNRFLDADQLSGFIKHYRGKLVSHFLDKEINGRLDKFDLDRLKEVLKDVREDHGAKGHLSQFKKIIDIGETILGFTTAAPLAKTIGFLAKGIFKVFGAKRKKGH